MAANSEEVSNANVSHHKGKISKGPRKKFYMSEIECYQCHKKGHYKSDCPENPRNKKRGRDQANFAEEGDSKFPSRFRGSSQQLSKISIPYLFNFGFM